MHCGQYSTSLALCGYLLGGRGGALGGGGGGGEVRGGGGGWRGGRGSGHEVRLEQVSRLMDECSRRLIRVSIAASLAASNHAVHKRDSSQQLVNWLQLADTNRGKITGLSCVSASDGPHRPLIEAIMIGVGAMGVWASDAGGRFSEGPWWGQGGCAEWMTIAHGG